MNYDDWKSTDPAWTDDDPDNYDTEESAEEYESADGLSRSGHQYGC